MPCLLAETVTNTAFLQANRFKGGGGGACLVQVLAPDIKAGRVVAQAALKHAAAPLGTANLELLDGGVTNHLHSAQLLHVGIGQEAYMPVTGISCTTHVNHRQQIVSGLDATLPIAHPYNPSSGDHQS